MTIRKIAVWTFGCVLLVACGGGGGGGSPLGSGPDLNNGGPPNGGASGNAKSLTRTSLRDLARDGYAMSVAVSDLLRDSRAAFRNGASGIATPNLNVESACGVSGKVEILWKDIDGDGTQSTKDQFDANYVACGSGATAIDGTAEFTLTGEDKYDFTIDLKTAEVAFSGRLAVDGNRFTTSDIQFGVAGGQIDFDGYQLSIQAMDATPTQNLTSSSFRYDFRFFVFDRGTDVFTSGVDIYTISKTQFAGTLGEFPNAGKMLAWLMFNSSLSQVEVAVSPDPSFLNVIENPNILINGDETVTTVAWTDFLG